jgi:hypothetical protein
MKELYKLAYEYAEERCEVGEIRVLINKPGSCSDSYYFNGIGFTNIDALIAKLYKLKLVNEIFKGAI